jgi:AAT family amino acid transporter
MDSIFYKFLGIGFNFLSETNLEALAASGMTALPEGCGKTLTLEALVNPNLRLAERAVVTFVLIGFFSYPFITILFEKWPVRPSNLVQPQAGLVELGWTTTIWRI